MINLDFLIHGLPVLEENERLNPMSSLKEKAQYQFYQKNISKEMFDDLVELDPFNGKYDRWIVETAIRIAKVTAKGDPEEYYQNLKFIYNSWREDAGRIRKTLKIYDYINKKKELKKELPAFIS